MRCACPSAPAPSGLRRWSGPGRGEEVRLPPGRRRRDRAPAPDPGWDARARARTRGLRRGGAPGRTSGSAAVRAARMGGDVPHPRPPPPGFSRRTLLAASAAGLALLVAGCSSPPADPREQVTSEQADELAAQVAVQEALVAAFAAAGAADPALGAAVAELAAQADAQLDPAAGGRSGRRRARRRRRPPRPGGRGRAGMAARPGRRGGDVARHGLPWTSRGPGRRCSDRSPRVCAARTGDWRDRSMADDNGPGALDERTENAALQRGARRRARRGLGLRRGRCRARRGRPAAGRRRRGGPPRRPRPGQLRCWPAARPTSSTPRAAYALPFPVLSAVDAAALGVVLEDGVAAAWVRVLDQAAERRTRELAVGRAERRRGARRGLARRRRPDAGHQRPFPGLPATSWRAPQPRAPRNASVTATAMLLD